MTDTASLSDTAAPAPGNSKPRSKGGVPRVPLATAESYARSLWNTARRAEAIPIAVARAISGKPDAKAEGGAWRTKAASLRVFNLVARLSNENLKLSEIGLALVDESNPDGQKQARRQAILSVPVYLKLLTDHNGNPLPAESTVATTFEFQYDLATAAAKEAAGVFAASVTHAGLIDANGNIQIDTSEVPSELQPETSTMAKPAKTTKSTKTTAETTPSELVPHTPENEQTNFNAPPPRNAAGGSAAPVGVNVTIDMSKWQADDVLSVLKVLGYGRSGE